MNCPKCGHSLPADSKFCQYCGSKLIILSEAEQKETETPVNLQFKGKTCPFCKAPFLEGEAIVFCSHCEMPHHLDCWKENGGCTTFGCTGNIGKIIGGEQKDPRSAPVATKTSVVPTASGATPAVPKSVPYPTGKTTLSTQKKTAPKQDGAENKTDEILAENTDRIIQGNIPVMLEKSVIKKGADGKLYAVCSFVPLTDKRIQAMQVDVLCFDIWRERVQSVEGYQYLDLRTTRDQSFGGTEKIPLPDPITRVIDIVIQRIMFSDGTMIKREGKSERCPPPVPLSQFLDKELLDEYKLQTFKNARFVPASNGKVWVCACGAFNREDETNCHFCMESFADLSSHLDKSALQKSIDEKKRIQREKEERERKAREEALRQKKEQEERKRKAEEEALKIHRERVAAEEAERARIKKEEEEKRKARNSKIALISGIAATLALVVYLVGWQLIPAIRYNNAEKALAAGDYDTAYSIFLKLNDYKDSTERAFSTRYTQGETALESGDYSAAYAFFSEISVYQDSNTIAQYARAMSLLENEEYEEAAKLFEVTYYRDSKARAQEAYYYYAKELIEQGKLHDAYTILSVRVNYKGKSSFKDSTELANVVEYQYASDCMAAEKYDEAYVSFGNIREYEDSNDLYLEAGYLYGLQLVDEKNFKTAAGVFSSLEKYKDSEKQANESKYQYALSLREEKK